ncbi:MucR family transcriptional regulator [Bartonella ancashensis]|uniref:Transcriptional regulatory protein, ros/mucR family n=1 Tax=Bartonella ancashensis TaxID=1318743 RepID=A0A0M5KTY8_9HYPH|nr:MucR family transcriptional regulator [Bartonella ancashensis]ALE04040.1 Transcriptional regulatory protein, ros/mucR family [Bartonella ancashensis]
MEHYQAPEVEGSLVVTLVADVVAAYVSNNLIQPAEVPSLIADVHAAFLKVGNATPLGGEIERQKPAVNPKRSVFPDYLVCLEDGKKFKSLKRHLMTHYKMSPQEYREKWQLDSSYPMVAPNYTKVRSTLAKEMGLGHKRQKKKTR